jgi:hypothetical protein
MLSASKRGGSEAERPDRAGVFPAVGIRQSKGLEFGNSSAESKALLNCSSFLVGKLRRFRVEGSVLFLVEGSVDALLILLGG